MSNVFSPLLDLFESQPSNVWIECDGEDFTGDRLISRIVDTQQNLLSKGIEEQDKVLIFSGRSAFFWVDVMAVWGLGCVAVPVDSSASSEELDYIANKAEPKYCLGLGDRKINSVTTVVDVNKTECKKSDIVCVDVEWKSIASILFTSGSTGKPKGVMLTHSSVKGNAIATVDSFEMVRVNRIFVPIPFRFVSSLSHFLASLYNHVVFSGTERKFLKTELLEELQGNQADAFGGSPLQLRWIAELAAEYNLNLKWLMASGDNLPKETILTLKKTQLTIRIVTAYGLTEVAGRFCILPPSNTMDKLGSVGKPIPGLNFKVLDDDLNEVETGESGQIFINGDFVFSGYINDPEKTEKALSSGSLATGDIGYVDSDGYLYLSGRADDVFKSGGLKVSALPIAAQLMSTGVFDDVVVLPKKDEVLGNIPIVYYVIKSDGELSKGPLMRLLRSNLPPGHLPREFIRIDSIPRTGSGKVQRGMLKTKIANLGSN